MSTEPSTAPARRSRMGCLPLAILGGVILVLFTLVTALYDSEGGLTQTGESTEETTSGFTAELSPVAVRPLTRTSTVRLSFTWIGDDVAAAGRLGQNTRVTVLTGTGVSETRYPAGTVPATVEVEMAVSGEQAASSPTRSATRSRPTSSPSARWSRTSTTSPRPRRTRASRSSSRTRPSSTTSPRTRFRSPSA